MHAKIRQVKILEADEVEGKLVVSQRLCAASSPHGPVHRRGSLVNVTVTGEKTFGVFVVTHEGTAGLLHVSQVSSMHVNSTQLASMFRVGEQLRVVVMEHDLQSKRLAVSTRVLELQPGDMLRDKEGVMANATENLAK